MATWERRAVIQMMRNGILELCQRNSLWGGQIEIDGIICITGKLEGQELVVKVHEQLGMPSPILVAPADLSKRPSKDSLIAACLHAAPPSLAGPCVEEIEAEDFSMKRPRLSVPDTNLDYPHLKQQLLTPPQQRLREITESAKDLSTSASSVMAHNKLESPDSPPPGIMEDQGYSTHSGTDKQLDLDSSNESPRGGIFKNNYPYTSTPHYFPKRIPLRPDRWSPGTPIPTSPECKTCGYTFENFELLSEHNEAVHSVFTCQNCFKTFTSRSNLERHARLHTGHKPYSCNICGKSFSRKDHLSNHATKHAFKCGSCSKRFADKKMLITHYTYDHNSILTNICDFCNKGFNNSESYEEHVKIHPQYHSGSMKDSPSPSPTPEDNNSRCTSPIIPQKLQCQECTFATYDRIVLLKHSIIHSESQRCYTCLSCAKMFTDPLKYSDHLTHHTSDTNIFECCLCRHICPTLSALKKHEMNHLNDYGAEPELSHTSAAATIEALTCPKCDKLFPTLSILQEHMEIHQHELLTSGPFSCAVCSQEFNSYTDLCQHIEFEQHYVMSEEGGSNGSGHSGHLPEEPRRGKRKQALPKALKDIENMDEGESDVEVVEPVAPEEAVMEKNQRHEMSDDDEEEEHALMIDDCHDEEMEDDEGVAEEIMEHRRRQSFRRHHKTNSTGFAVTDNPTSMVEADEQDGVPVKTLLNRALLVRQGKGGRQENCDTSALAEALAAPPPSKMQDHPISQDRGSPESSMSNESSATNNNLFSTSKMNVDLPPGPYNCAVCSGIFDSFQELEMHCFSEHNRSPCMFCSKTFAQKANRDRHVCLHTGEKPYACPDCDEKFSRGDKLKIHRIRAHKAQFPAYGGRGSRGAGMNTSAELPREYSPTPSPSGSHDSLMHNYVNSVLEGGGPDGHSDLWPGGRSEAPEGWNSSHNRNDPLYATGEWSIRKEVNSSFVHAGGEWSIKEDSREEVENGNDK